MFKHKKDNREKKARLTKSNEIQRRSMCDEEQSDKENRIRTRRSSMEIEDDDRHMDKMKRATFSVSHRKIYCAK